MNAAEGSAAGPSASPFHSHHHQRQEQPPRSGRTFDPSSTAAAAAAAADPQSTAAVVIEMGGKTPAPAAGRTDSHLYPPPILRQAEPGDGWQERIFGVRGVTALTVDTEPLSVQGRSSRVSEPRRSRGTPTQSTPARPSRWNTAEFKLYCLVFLIAVPTMIYVPVRMSSPGHNPNFLRFRGHLRQGWMFGRLRDDSDFQYRTLRDYIGLLAGVMLVFLGVGKVFSSLLPAIGRSSSGGAAYQPIPQGARTAPHSPPPPPPPPPRNRIAFLIVFTAVYITALHGSNVLKLLFISSVNFLLARTFAGLGASSTSRPTSAARTTNTTTAARPLLTRLLPPLLFWTWNVGALFVVHWNDGLPWSQISPSLASLDRYPGLLKRWQINFNITMLRLVSFSLDLHWARLASAAATADDRSSPRVGHHPSEASHSASTAPASASSSPEDVELDTRIRSSQHRPLEEYSYLLYLLHAFYPPLFIAGPIVTFNDFAAQLRRPVQIARETCLLYAVRFAACFLTMELVTHFMYVMAIKDTKAWMGATPLELSMIGFWNLITIWLKLLLPWRFFRLWAMLDGVEAPENMVRCMANNYSTLGFWRSWHRSYNLWIVRYIYVPVGGARNALPATLLVFTFVALWHDLSLKLLTWGWLVSFFILPEIAATALLPAKKFGDRAWHRHVSALGGVFNVLLMMTANLVGFAIGMDGMRYMWSQLLGSWDGTQFLVLACGTLFVGVQVM